MQEIPQTPKNDVPTGASSPTQEPQKLDLPHFLKSKKAKVVSLSLLVIFSLLLTSILALSKVRQKMQTAQTQSYEECLKAPGSKTQLSYPSVCVTNDGQRFTEPLSEEEKKRLKPPDPTADWKTYSDLDFSFKYPNKWTLNKYGKNGNLFSRQLVLIDPSNGNNTGIGSITLLVYDNPKQLSLENYEAEDVERFGKDAQRMVFYHPSGVYSKLGDSTALLLANEECEPGKCDVYLLSLKDNIYRIIVRYDFVNKTSITQILSTFKFIDISQSSNIFNDGYVQFSIPPNLQMTKDPKTIGVPYAQFKTKSSSSIQIDLSSELEIQCVNTVKEEAIILDGQSLTRTLYHGLPEGQLENCQYDNSNLRTEWIQLPVNIPNIGQTTLALRYNLQDELLAQTTFNQILSTIKFLE